MKLTARFSALVVVLVLAIGASCFAGLRALARLDDALQQVVRNDMQRLLVITTVRKQFRSMVVLEREHVLETSAVEMKAMTGKMLVGRRELAESLDRYERFVLSENRPALQNLRSAFAHWTALDDQVLAVSAAGKSEPAYALAQQHIKDPISWESVIADLVKSNERRLEQQTNAARSTYQEARLVLIGVALAAILFAGLAGTLVFSGIKRNMTQIKALNENLEQLVQQRTRALLQREQSIRLILDSTGDGLLTVNLKGELEGERSQAIAAWFGDPTPDQRVVWDFLGGGDLPWIEAFTFAFAQLADDVLPFELSAAQMPSRIERCDTHYALTYRQVFEDGVFARVLVVMSDVSERVRGERAEREAREQQEILGHLLRDRAAFRDFVHGCEQLIGEISATPDIKIVKRHLHTLKGNTAVYGFASIAHQCGKMEDALAETDEVGGVLHTQLSTMWRARLESIHGFFNPEALGTLEIQESEHAAVVDSLRERRDCVDILGVVEAWSWDRTVELLARLRAQSQRVATKLGKSIEVEIEDNALRTPRGPLDAFWPTLIHVIRNAIDHGIEDAEQRVALGKSPTGRLGMTTRIDAAQALVVELRDDGRGLDIDAINAAARRRGLRGATTEDALDALFSDGLSTRIDVTETSGRGVGMGAVRAACESAGGSIRIETAPGKGTTFCFRFPSLAIFRSGAPASRLTSALAA